jgi:hypothetical protein
MTSVPPYPFGGLSGLSCNELIAKVGALLYTPRPRRPSALRRCRRWAMHLFENATHGPNVVAAAQARANTGWMLVMASNAQLTSVQ